MIKIFIVDDKAIVTSQLEERLTKMGYEVTGKASSGEAAIEMLKRFRADLVLMDIVMPGKMNGIKAARVIREELDIPVIFLTGHAEDEFIEEAKSASPFGYIVKPFREREMKAVIDIGVYKKGIERLLRESEERFRTVADFTYDWEYWIGPGGEILYTSPSRERITGYSHGEFVDDPGLLEKIVHPDDHSTLINHLREEQALDDGGTIDFRIITRNGEERWISHNCQSVYGADGTYLGRRASNRDISKRKKMEEEVLKTRKLESLGVLAGGIAHDFNNMLTVVLGNISLARMMVETFDTGEAVKLLTEAEKAAMRAKDLTAQLITFSEGGEPFKEEVSIEEFIKDCVNSALSGAGIVWELHMPEDVWPVKIDESQMKQTVHNIVANAIEAMPGQGLIKVYCRNIDISEKNSLTLKQGKYLKISLKDQGAGIAQENLPKVFDPYFSTKERGTQKGMGLGLTVAYSVVKNHGGLITIESEVGGGTTVHIYIPASDFGLGIADFGLKRDLKTEERPSAKRDQVAEQSTIDNQQSSIQRILVMDDEEMVRNVFSAMFSRLGYEVAVAIDGVEAIEIYKKAMASDHPFNLVILDLTNASGMGGVEAIKILLELDPQIRAMVATGYSFDPVVSNFRAYGFCGAITKPFTMSDLGKAVQEAGKDS